MCVSASPGRTASATQSPTTGRLAIISRLSRRPTTSAENSPCPVNTTYACRCSSATRAGTRPVPACAANACANDSVQPREARSTGDYGKNESERDRGETRVPIVLALFLLLVLHPEGARSPDGERERLRERERFRILSPPDPE